MAGVLMRSPMARAAAGLVLYPLILQLTNPQGFWLRACDSDVRGAMWRGGYLGAGE